MSSIPSMKSISEAPVSYLSIAAQVWAFKSQGGFTERLDRVRSERRR